MGKDKQRIMENRAKKKARDAAKKKRNKQQAGGGGRFEQMGCTRGELKRSPVHAAYVGNSVFSSGIGHAIIARRLPDGRIAAGVFLVDAYCLGIKDAFLAVQSPIAFNEIIGNRFNKTDLKAVDPAYARKLIDGSIAYARDLGFEPHPDFRDASVVLGDIDATECPETFSFGKDGKPFYVSGPNHSESTARRIVTHLMNRCGPDGAHYLVELTDPFRADAPDLDGDSIAEDEEWISNEPNDVEK